MGVSYAWFYQETIKTNNNKEEITENETAITEWALLMLYCSSMKAIDE